MEALKREVHSMKKFNSILLSIVLAAGVFFCISPVSLQTVYGSGEEAKIVETDKTYSTLLAAGMAVKKGQTIQLLQDVNFGAVPFESLKTYTLDLNGHTLKGGYSLTKDRSAVEVSAGTLTVTDSSPEGTGLILNRSPFKGTAVKATGFGSVVIAGGSVTSNNGAAVYNAGKRSTVTIDAGTMTGADPCVVNEGGDFILNGGRFSDDSAAYNESITIQKHRSFVFDEDGYYVLSENHMISIEFGAGHEAMAGSWANYLNSEDGIENCEAAADGSKVMLFWDNSDMTVGDAQQDLASRLKDCFDPEGKGFIDNGVMMSSLPLGQKTADGYPSKEYLKAELYDNSNYYFIEDCEFFIQWMKPIDSFGISVGHPVCGETVEGEYLLQDNIPKVEFDSDLYGLVKFGSSMKSAAWMTDEENSVAFNGTFEGDKTYIADVWLEPAYGYYFTKDIVAGVGDGTVAEPPADGSNPEVFDYGASLQISVRTTAVHDWEGSTCKACGAAKYSEEDLVKVYELIAALPDDPAKASKAKVAEAVAAYKALPAELRALFDEDELYILQDAVNYPAKSQKVTLKSVKAKKCRKALVKWKKNTKVSGYQLYYKAKGVKAKKVNITSYKTLKKTIKNLKACRKYSFKIRPYTKVEKLATGKKVKVYGKWSKVKKITAKC